MFYQRYLKVEHQNLWPGTQHSDRETICGIRGKHEEVHGDAESAVPDNRAGVWRRQDLAKA